jgi:FdhE protein
VPWYTVENVAELPSPALRRSGAEQFTHVRIDACDPCHRYIKTIDLSKDGLAVPCVDDIASVSLDLWARERGYTRIRQNVFGF